MSECSVSVIVPAYNAAATAGKVIEAVLAQDYAGRIELIVVDDGSTDATLVIVRSYSNVKYLFQENQGPASARNYGAREACGDILLFTDADCCPDPGWITGMTGGFNDAQVSVVAGSYGIANPGSALARIIHGEIRFRHEHLMPEYPRAFGSYNVAIRSALFRRLGGFDAGFRRASGEDNDLSYRVLRAGSSIRFLKNVCVAHYHQEYLERYLREQFRHGFWRARLLLDHSMVAAADDYTFWKDVVEVPLVMAHLLLIFWPTVLFVMVAGFFLFEIAAAVCIFGPVVDGLFGGIVMWLRAFARTAGLFFGTIYFLKIKLMTGKKS
ncbi:MAG: glycosyltransferase [Candidatus Omnitrophica bacterium]|nr:glycosyltransferase [Candidatus Omnitrophota bacterium]